MGVDLELLFQIKREINFIRIRAKADMLMLSIFYLRGQADREKFSRYFSYFNLIESLLSLGMKTRRRARGYLRKVLYIYKFLFKKEKLRIKNSKQIGGLSARFETRGGDDCTPEACAKPAAVPKHFKRRYVG
jgi:hypothetical protein